MSDPFPNPFGGGPNPFGDNRDLPQDPVYDRSEPPDVSSEDLSTSKRRGSAGPILRKYYLILLACGLLLGLFVAIGVVKVITHLGLNEVPAQVE
ncbi:hypothetical protein [Baaleninema simplex]|uniref:hypothetical protein n=1 Tax=Baaleninema simplex TaxID=2862350 RepID=UPI00034DABC4|nr:hypothetical protein [Baaleninema simplex]